MSLRLILLVVIVAAERILRCGGGRAGIGAPVPPRRSSPAKAARRRAPRWSLLANPGRLLSVTQVGVTLASLGLGWAGEDTIYQMLMRLVHPIVTPQSEVWLHGAGFAIAFLLISFCHVVIGEVVPKNLAIEKADRLALLMAPALLVFLRISAPFVFVIEHSAAGSLARPWPARRPRRRRAFARRTQVHRRLRAAAKGTWRRSRKTPSRICST